MSTQICPKCKLRSFTWYLDEEIDTNERWLCSKCHYDCSEKEFDKLTLEQTESKIERTGN